MFAHVHLAHLTHKPWENDAPAIGAQLNWDNGAGPVSPAHDFPGSGVQIGRELRGCGTHSGDVLHLDVVLTLPEIDEGRHKSI